MKTKAVLILAIMALVLVTMVACMVEISESTPSAEIPTEPSPDTVVSEVGEEEKAVIQGVFEYLINLFDSGDRGIFSVEIEGEEEEDVEEEDPPVINGTVCATASDGSVTVEATTFMETAIPEATIEYSGLSGSGSVEDNVISAKVCFSSTRDEALSNYELTVNGELFSKEGPAIALTKDSKETTDVMELYYAYVVLFDSLESLNVKVSSCLIDFDSEELTGKAKISGSFSVSMKDGNPKVALCDVEGTAFSRLSFYSDSANATASLVASGRIINASCDVSRITFTIGKDENITTEDSITTTETRSSITITYDSISVSANMDSTIIAKVETTNGNYYYDIEGTNVTYSDNSAEDTTTKSTMTFSGRAGAGLIANDSALGFLADITNESIFVPKESSESIAEFFANIFGIIFNMFDFSNAKVKPVAATINGKYVNAQQFYDSTIEIGKALLQEE